MISRIANPEAVAWVISAEGTITISSSSHDNRAYYYADINIYNTDREFLLKFYDMVGHRGYLSKEYKSDNALRTNWKSRSYWALHRRSDAYLFLSEIILFLPTKQNQARLVMSFCRTGDSSLFLVVKCLNIRGLGYGVQK